MLQTFPVALAVGTALGFLSGLGIGGGSLLILWLTLVLDLPQGQARTMNLLFFLPAAVIAALFRWKQGAIPLKKIFPAMIWGSIAAAVFSWIGLHVMDLTILKKLFGGLLLITGLRELFYKPKPKQ